MNKILAAKAKEYLEKIVVPSDAEIYVEEGMDSIPLVDIMVDFAQQQIEGARYEYSVRMPNHALIGDDTKVIERIINGNAEAGIEYVGQYGRFVVYRRRILDGERKPNNG